MGLTEKELDEFKDVVGHYLGYRDSIVSTYVGLNRFAVGQRAASTYIDTVSFLPVFCKAA